MHKLFLASDPSGSQGGVLATEVWRIHKDDGEEFVCVPLLQGVLGLQKRLLNIENFLICRQSPSTSATQAVFTADVDRVPPFATPEQPPGSTAGWVPKLPPKWGQSTTREEQRAPPMYSQWTLSYVLGVHSPTCTAVTPKNRGRRKILMPFKKKHYLAINNPPKSNNYCP